MIPCFAFHHTNSISYYRHFNISKVFPIFRHSRIICEQTYFTICIVFAMQLFNFQRSIVLQTKTVFSLLGPMTAFLSVRTCRLNNVNCFFVVCFWLTLTLYHDILFTKKPMIFCCAFVVVFLVCVYIIHQNHNAKKYIFF